MKSSIHLEQRRDSIMINVLFFGAIADHMQKRECLLPGHEPMTIEEMVSAVGCADLQPLLVAVNQVQIHDTDYLLHAGDEVALMPPFSGG